MRALLAGLVLYPLSAFVAHAGEGPGILDIFDQMIVSRAAAELCASPTRELGDAFEANFRVVSYRAMEEIEKRRPARSVEDIANAMAARKTAIASKVKDIVQSRGCEHPEVAAVVKRFEVQSRFLDSRD